MSGEATTSTARVQVMALLAGAAGLAICAAVGISSPARVMPPYLVGLAFWIGVSLGSLAIVMLHQLVGGEWGVPLRRPAEAAALTIPLLGFLFMPIVMNPSSLYPWADAQTVASSADLTRKSVYLNPQAFAWRALGVFVAWSLLGALMVRWSRRRDRTEAASPSWWMSHVGGPGLVIYFVTMSIAAIDWMMSREPDWTSTIYGPMVIIGQGLSALAVLIVIASLLARWGGAMSAALTPDRLNDQGNLMLAFVMLWAYMAFSQFLIIWSGNLADEIPWYLRRTSGGYEWVALALILFHFAVPFAVLMFRDSKRSRQVLPLVAAAVAAMHVLDLAWLILPASDDRKLGRVVLTDAPLVLAAVVGVGGLWLTLFLRILGTAPILSVRDPITGEIAAPEPGRHHG
jgi:hypothetical protein